MFKNLFGLFTNISVIFSMILELFEAKHNHKNTLIPKIGLIISVLTLILHLLTLFNDSKETQKENNLLEKLF